MCKTYASFTSYLHNSWFQFRYIDNFVILIQTEIVGYVCFGSRGQKFVSQITNIQFIYQRQQKKCVDFKFNNDVSRNVIDRTHYM